MKTRRITLETHLHKIAEYDETVKNLESVFNIQKQKVIRYIGSVVTSFPTYSTHDAVHSMNIISAIEKILGQKTIKKMSGIDTFLILMCAYMHDTGMLYSDEEVKQLWETEGFQDFLTSARKREDEVGRAARKIDKAEKGEGCSVLEVRRSVAVILMEYFRPRHGQRIKHVTDARTSEFGSLLSIDDSFLPDRIIHNIYRISMAHNWSFEDILKEMPLADSFGVEEFHPRMVAYLIRMGDLCDMDNNRFNGVGIKVFGNLGEENLAHYFKHKSVETLHISSDGIVVVANVCYDMIQRECEENWLKHMEKAERDSALKNIFQNTVKEHINWKSWLEQEVTAGKMHSMELFPEKKFISVPELKYKILIDGEESESIHKNLKFLFSSEKAFKLIEDISIYQNNKLIFVRELIQNALDATKMQLYRTLSAYGFQFNEKTSPFDVERAYPNIFEEHAIMIHTDYSRETGKVYFSIRDKGIGISMDEFKRNILTTGRSWPERKEYQDEIKRMPEWLRPTGAFGIGLHTVFSVTDSLTIRTKSDSENKANEMTLYSGKKGGYAFCKKTNQTLQRGSEFSFSFLLTEELKEWVTGSNGGKLFLENVNDGIQKEIKKIMETWCVTPMVSIYADQDYGIPAFSQSTWYNELSRTEKENQLIDQSVESERYHFAFTDDYRSIMVWDREKDCALSFGMESMGGDNVCYKGIRLTERMESGKCSDSLYLNQMDVLDGVGNDWVDAARMKLSLAARRKLESVVEEATAFAKRIYVFMLDEFYQNNDIRNLTNDIDAMANRIYQKKEISLKEIWTEGCELKKKYWGMPERWNHKMLTRKTLPYFLIVKMLDKSIKLWDPEAGMGEVQHIFCLADQLIKRWKMDWNGMHGESFPQPDFDQQMRTLLQHFLQIAGIGFSYVAFEKVKFDDNEKNTLFEYKNLITQKSFQLYQKAFPFCSQWKFTKDMYQCVEESAISGLIRWRPEFRNRVPDSIRWKYCLPNSALDKVFVKWRAEHCFSNVKPLEIFLRFSGIPEIVLDIPGENCPIGEKEKKVWRKFCTESYLNWKLFYRIRPLSEAAKDMLNKETIVLRRPFTTYISELFPVFHRMSLVSMDERRMEFSIHNSNTHGVQIDSQTKKRIFKEFWKEVERSHDPKGYVAMIGMEEYPMLGIENAEEQYHAQIGMLAKYPEIPLWDYGAGIKAFMDQFIGCPIDEKSQEIIDRIINSEGGKAVIHYIAVYRKKTGDDVKEEKIETQYREFLKDLIYCWADGRCTFG